MRPGNDSARNSPPHNETACTRRRVRCVVRDDGGDEENGDTEERLRPDYIEHPHAAERGRKQRNRGEQHEPFVRVGRRR